MYSDTVTVPRSGTKMRCDACPIDLDVEKFAVLRANGWDGQHTFQRNEFNAGHVVACTGHFSLAAA